MEQLTKRQKQVLMAIAEHIEELGYPPTVREIGLRLGLRSSCTVQRHVEALVRKGFLRRQGHKSRGIEVVDRPDSPAARRLAIAGRSQTVLVPLVGRVAAGVPLLAEEHIEGYLPLSRELVGEDEVFMLRVRGDSMIEAGLYDGDYVVVRRQAHAENGDIVVAMTEDGEATVKYFYRDKNKIRLQPANKDMEPIVVRNVTILGKAILAIRPLSRA